MRFHLLFRGRLQRGVTALPFCVAVAASLLPMGSAQAQFYTWAGSGSTSATSDYNLGSNWSNPPAGAPPTTNGQAAIFDATGSASIGVTSTVKPYSWTFTANSQSYSVGGADINFGSGVWGVFNLANAGQFISIANNIGESAPGAQVGQLGASTLILSGNNTYSGGTLIAAGTVQVTNNNSVGSGAVTLDGGAFQTNGAGGLTFTNNFNVNTNGGTVDNNGVMLTLSGIIANGNGATGVLQVTDSSGGFGTTVLSGVNTYAGGTLVSGATLRVTNNQSVGFGAVTLDRGTFQAVGASSLTFTNGFKVNTGGGTIDSNGTVLTLSGVISNGNGATGVLHLTDTTGGGGLTVLSGVNTYSGGTKVTGTAVQVTNNSSVGTGTVTLDNALFLADGLSNLTFKNNFKIDSSLNGSAIDANGTTLTIAGNISDGIGHGKLTVADSSVAGGGAVVLLGNNTYTGGTTICACAALQLGDATHTASLVGTVDVEGLFGIVNANTAGITKIVNDGLLGQATTMFHNATTAGTATIVNVNGGLTVFRDTSSAGNAVFKNTNGGRVVFGDALGPPGGSDASTAGNAVIDNFSGGGAVFLAHTNAGHATITNHSNGGSTLFFESASAASAIIVNSAGGFTGFFMNSTAGNATIDNSSLTYFGTSGFSRTEAPTAGNATIINRSGGILIFDAYATGGNATITTESGANVSFTGNSTGGAAQFITNGSGFVDFGGSVGPNGDRRITAGSIAGSGSYFIGGGNTLVVGGNNHSTTMSGVIADFNPCGCGPLGAGNLEKTGSGTLILSGTNTYTGTTAVNGGILQVDGSIASSGLTTVNAGGLLTGVGTVGNTTIASGGIFMPGNGTPGSFTTVAGGISPSSFVKAPLS
ncbi:beta strand repeat-containing protein [Bradyrhizobium erythrophlei]|uniref:beta strand repeat-containing protein n=1 Tax=Bradyrhizobium erythrophlei TaxID=1437360 RepID=UPI0035EA7745